jgi:hypothetical protein
MLGTLVLQFPSCHRFDKARGGYIGSGGHG